MEQAYVDACLFAEGDSDGKSGGKEKQRRRNFSKGEDGERMDAAYKAVVVRASDETFSKEALFRVVKEEADKFDVNKKSLWTRVKGVVALGAAPGKLTAGKGPGGHKIGVMLGLASCCGTYQVVDQPLTLSWKISLPPTVSRWQIVALALVPVASSL